MTLPNTHIKVAIPLLKFVLDVPSKNIPFGRGVLADYKIEPKFQDVIDGVDAELEFTLDLIQEHQWTNCIKRFCLANWVLGLILRIKADIS